MLGLIAQSLDFVTLLRLGDPLPAEVLSGAASWEPDPLHLQLANARLQWQLVTWLNSGTGGDAPQMDAEALRQLADDRCVPGRRDQLDSTDGGTGPPAKHCRAPSDDTTGRVMDRVREQRGAARSSGCGIDHICDRGRGAVAVPAEHVDPAADNRRGRAVERCRKRPWRRDDVQRRPGSGRTR